MKAKKITLVVLGFFALAIGSVGIILPILPTTPFVVAAAACFGGSSEKLYNKLLNTKYFGEYIENYRSKKGITMESKLRGILFLWTMLISSAIIFERPAVNIILMLVGIGVSIHILLIHTKDR